MIRLSLTREIESIIRIAEFQFLNDPIKPLQAQDNRIEYKAYFNF